MWKRKIIEPASLNDQDKIKYLAQMHMSSIYPTAFRYDNSLSLISLLARRIVELENNGVPELLK